MGKLLDLVNEEETDAVSIIMAGAAASGKSTVIKAINPMIKGFKILNADNYIEDPKSKFHNNLAGATKQVRDTDIPQTIESKQNLVYDTTASKLSTINPIIDKLKSNGYSIIMVMVYAHPIVSFIRNFKRQRKVPAVGVIRTWVEVYNLIEDYKQMFGNKFFLISSPSSTREEHDMVKKFENAYGQNKLHEFFDELISSGEYESTFKKSEDELSPEELEKKNKSKEKTKQILSTSIDILSKTYGDIESKLDPIPVGELPQKISALL